MNCGARVVSVQTGKVDDHPQVGACSAPKEIAMDADYIRIRIQNVLQREIRDLKKSLKDGDVEKASKKADALEKDLRNLLAFF